MLEIWTPDVFEIWTPDVLEISTPDVLGIWFPDLLKISTPDLFEIWLPDPSEIWTPDLAGLAPVSITRSFRHLVTRCVRELYARCGGFSTSDHHQIWFSDLLGICLRSGRQIWRVYHHCEFITTDHRHICLPNLFLMSLPDYARYFLELGQVKRLAGSVHFKF